VNSSAGSEEPDQYGVVGHPISHSWSPFIHGMFAKATAQNLVYRLFDVPPENFRRDALRLFAGGIKGLNVTMPHKQAAAELVNELTPRAERAKAVNTIAFFEQTSLLGDNTDGLGLTADLENNLGLALADKRVLILGAGGAVRGVLGSLMERDLREVVIGLTIVKRAEPGENASYFGQAQTVPAVAGIAPQLQDSLQKQPDVTFLLKVKGSAAPSATAIFRTPLNFALFPDQEWHWAIVKARGIPPHVSPAAEASMRQPEQGVGQLPPALPDASLQIPQRLSSTANPDLAAH